MVAQRGKREAREAVRTKTEYPLYLTVPFAEKDEAFRLGALYDPQAKLWYAASSSELAALGKWYKTPLVEFPGENRAYGGSRLYVDLVPKSCWFVNVRSAVAPSEWGRVRRLVYARAEYRCECCGVERQCGDAPVSIEAHERWSYCASQKRQRLERLIALCSHCHSATHYGLASIRGRGAEAVRQLERVNGWSEREAVEHIAEAFAVWKERNHSSWILDINIITQAGVELMPSLKKANLLHG